jgi:hypothetical protein
MEDLNPSMPRLLVTENSRYHVVDDVCIAVLDERSGCWHRMHQAIGGRVVGALRMNDDGTVRARLGAPELGERVIFSTDVVTSTLIAIELVTMGAFRAIPLAGAA